MVALVIALAALAPVVVDLLGVPGPNVRNTGTVTALHVPTGPSSAHPLGVDGMGRDLLARIVYGLRSSLEVAALATAIALLLGTALALIASRAGGLIDALVLGVADALLAIPVVLLGLGVAAARPGHIQVGFGTVVLVIAVSSAARVARFARGRAGSSSLAPALIGYAIFLIGVNMLLEAALSFLGAGLRGSEVSFGQMISAAGSYVVSGNRVWWYLLFPGVALTFAVLAFSLLGEAILTAAGVRPRSDYSLDRHGSSIALGVARAALCAIFVVVATFLVFVSQPHLGTLWNLFRLKLGTSSQTGHSVLGTVTDALPATVSLAGGVVVLGAFLAVAMGMIATVRPGRILSRASAIAARIVAATPVFWLGFGGIYLFARDVGIAPVFDAPGSYAGLTASPSRWFGSLLLPWLILAIGLAAFHARVLRSRLGEAMTADYITTARSKGLRERRVLIRHGLRAALPDLLPAFAAGTAALLGAVVLIEVVFNVPGIGRLAYDSLRHGDLPVLRGAILLGALLVLVTRLVVGLMYPFVDPRARHHP